MRGINLETTLFHTHSSEHFEHIGEDEYFNYSSGVISRSAFYEAMWNTYYVILIMSREKNGGGKGVEHTHHIEFVVAAHRMDVEGPPYVLLVLVVLVADVGVGQLGVKGLFGSDLLLVQLLPAIHILVWLNSLPHE